MPEFVIPKLESIKELEGEPLGIIVPATSSHRQRSYPLSMAEYVPLMAFIKRGEGTESDVTYEMADYLPIAQSMLEPDVQKKFESHVREAVLESVMSPYVLAEFIYWAIEERGKLIGAAGEKVLDRPTGAETPSTP